MYWSVSIVSPMICASKNFETVSNSLSFRDKVKTHITIKAILFHSAHYQPLPSQIYLRTLSTKEAKIRKHEWSSTRKLIWVTARDRSCQAELDLNHPDFWRSLLKTLQTFKKLLIWINDLKGRFLLLKISCQKYDALRERFKRQTSEKFRQIKLGK